MDRKINKFSFVMGALMICLIIGCVAQVGLSENPARYQLIPHLGNGMAFIESSPGAGGSNTVFSVLDTGAGTVNVWTADGQVHVYEFHVVQPN